MADSSFKLRHRVGTETFFLRLPVQVPLTRQGHYFQFTLSNCLNYLLG